MDNIFKRFRRVFSFILAVLLIVGSTGLENVFAETENKKYSMEELSVLNSEELVEVLSTSYYKDITGLYSYSDGAVKIYSDEVKMDAIRKAIELRGREFTEDDDKGLDTLIYFIRSGYYLGFDDVEGGRLKHLGKREYRDKCIPAMLAIQRNPNFKLGTKTQNLLIGSVGEFVENTSSNAEVINNFIPILEDFNRNLPKYVKNENKEASAIYKILSGVKRDVDMYINQECRCESKSDYDPEENSCYCYEELSDAPWFENIDGFIELVEDLTKVKDIKENELVLDNALFTISLLGSLHSDNTIGHRALTDGMKNYELLSNAYLRAGMEIAFNHNEVDYYGKSITEDELREAAEAHYYGNEYVFDDGDIVIKAGDKVRKDKILKIYWGLKEVESQFFRAIGTDEILEDYLIDVYFLEKEVKKSETDDYNDFDEIEEEYEKMGRTDRKLNIVIYNSPDEYNINNVLNGIDTMNGGMYVKNLGTFYTYERTRNQSKYTLEELARHEFTHYLQGKHVFNGNWNEGDFYRTGSVYWYEEGGAEYFAGSTRTEGVVARRNMVNNIAHTSEEERYSVNELVNFTYDNFNSLYDYGFMFMNYVKDKNPEIFNKLTNYIIKDDINGFTNYLDFVRRDPVIEKGYREHMDKLIKNKDDLYVPRSSDLYLNRHVDKNINEILGEVRDKTGLRDLEYNIKKSDDFNTVKIEGIYYSDMKSKGEVLDKIEMDRIANEMLVNLSDLEWSGYDTFTAYFKNHRVDSNENFIYDLVLHGVKQGEGYEIDPKDLGKIYPKIKLMTDYKTMTHTRFMGGSSMSENGDIISYDWIIDGKEYSGEYIDIMFENPGKYDVKLIVKDDTGMFAETETIIEIEKRKEPGYTTEPVEPLDPDDPGKIVEGIMEEEPNDEYLAANSLTSRRLGETNVNDMDWYYFDIITEGEYEIKLEKLKGDLCAFTVHKEDRIDDIIDYPTDIRGSELRSKNYYKAGRYYVKVYGFSKDKNKYSLEIN